MRQAHAAETGPEADAGTRLQSTESRSAARPAAAPQPPCTLPRSRGRVHRHPYCDEVARSLGCAHSGVRARMCTLGVRVRLRPHPPVRSMRAQTPCRRRQLASRRRESRRREGRADRKEKHGALCSEAHGGRGGRRDRQRDLRQKATRPSRRLPSTRLAEQTAGKAAPRGWLDGLATRWVARATLGRRARATLGRRVCPHPRLVRCLVAGHSSRVHLRLGASWRSAAQGPGDGIGHAEDCMARLAARRWVTLADAAPPVCRLLAPAQRSCRRSRRRNTPRPIAATARHAIHDRGGARARTDSHTRNTSQEPRCG